MFDRIGIGGHILPAMDAPVGLFVALDMILVERYWPRDRRFENPSHELGATIENLARLGDIDGDEMQEAVPFASGSFQRINEGNFPASGP